MPGHLWLLAGIILVLLSFVLISNVIMPSLTIFTNNSSPDTKRHEESERKCKSLNYLNSADSSSNKVQLRPPEGETAGLNNEEAGSDKENLSTVNNTGRAALRTLDVRAPPGTLGVKTVNICVDNVEPSTCQYDARSKVKLQSISDLVEDGYELRIARLETLPIRPNDCKGIKVAKVIRTQNVLGKKSGNVDENGHYPVGSEESFSETINQNKRISSDMDDGNLVPNFIIGDMLYNYDLSLNKDTSIVYEESNCVDTTSETTETNDPIDDEDIPYLDLNELKRKKRRKRNKCMEIFNVPMEALNRIEEEDGQPGVSSRDRNDLVVLKTEASDEHVPSLELVNLDSDRNQVLSGFNETRPHSVAPNSIDFQFSWVFNQQFTMDAVHGPSHSFPCVYITNDLHENGLSYEKTFDSFNKPLKRDADSLTISKVDELSSDVKGEKSIESESKSKMFLKKNKMVDIKSKLKEVKIEKPLLLNGKMPSEMKRDVNDVKAEDNVDRRKEYSDLQNGFLSGTSSIPKISFSDTTIDECCTTDTHQQCSLLNNPKVEEPQNSHVIAPDHFHLRNDTEMPNITLNLAEPSDKHFEQNDLVAIAETSPCYFSLKNDKVMNFSHCQKSITDLDYLIGSFQYDPHVDTTPPREPQMNSLSYLPAANNDLTNNAGENSPVSLEENALRSLDELCTKSLESISEPLSITSTKSKKVTFLEDLDKTNTVDPLAESPVEQTVNSILDDECDKESDTLVEDDVMSLSSSTSSLTSSSSESSGQSMIFNGIPANTETSTQETEIAPKIDATILKHTSVVTALNQHNFHTYLSPIKELSLEINMEETELQNEQPEIPNKEFVDTRSWTRLEENARDMKMDECVTSFCNDTFMEENRASPDEEVRLVVAKVEEVKSEKWQPIRVDAVSNTDHVRSNDNIGDCTSEVPIKPVVLNTKFIMADLTNQSKNASVSKQSNVKESDGLENCSDRCKTNSSGSDLSSELEHILSSIEYESSQPSHSPHLNQHTSSESNCSSQSVSSNENDSQDVFHKERRYTKVKPTGSSYLSLKKYALSNVPKKLTEETLSNDKDGCSKYRQIVFEKIKNFENITCPKDESDGCKTTKPSKLPEPKIKAHLSQKVTSSGYSETSPHKVAQVSGSSRFEGARKIVQVPKVSDKVKNFEKKILERENSKSPSPEPSDFKNLFTEKLSNFENMAKKFTNGSAFKNGNGIDLKVNKSISEKLQSFESMSSSSRESSTSPDFTQGKVETKTKSSNEHFKPKIPLKSLRSSFEEKLRNCQLLSDNSSKEVPKPPSPKTTKNQIDVLKKISTFESQIKTENEPQKKDSALSKIPKKKTKSLESIFSSQQAKAKSDRSSSHENILQRDSTSSKVQVPMESSHKVQVQSELSECNKSPSKLKYSPPLSTIQLVSSPTNFVKGSVGQFSSKISGEGMKERVGVERKQEGDLTGKLEMGNFSKPSQGYGAGDFPNQTRVTTSPPKSVDQFDNKAALSEEDKELPIMTHQPEPHEKKFKDIMNDSGITEDFEDGLKINTSQDHIKEMLTSIEAIEKLVVPNVSRVCQRLSSPVPEIMNQCHTTQSHIFFRSSVLPQLEAERDKKLSSRVIEFQARCRGYLARKHLAKLKVQDVAVRCIQRNVRKFMDVRDWSWWRLYLKINPLLNVHRTDQELQAKSEELEALKSKLEKLEVERNLLKQDNTRLETKLGEITEDYADEHSTATLATERLTHESSERSRLEKELAEAQSTNKKLQETSEKLELEVQCLRSTDALSLDLSDEGSDATGGEGDLYRKKWERAMRELEFTKHRLTQQHQDDLEQLVGLRKQLEKKLSDAYEQIEEQRNVAAEWKRKVARVNSEMSDQRLLLEEQSSRNTLLEKKQRKFDAEYQMLQDELRQERNQKEKALRDKELALGDKYTMEQNLSSLKLELELKDQKLSSLAQELEELTFSGNTEEEVANLKKKKHALEAKLSDQEEELDELAGQVQMLEQAKLKVEMNLEQVRKAHRKELASKDEELEALRCSTMKKVKALQSQLESEHESRTALLRERHELERRLANLEDMGVATRSAEVETNQRLKKDLKRTKALLKDTQTMLAQSRQDNPNKLLVRQLRNQLEDAEVSRNVATKARQTMESDLADVTVQLEETSRAKSELETRLSAVLRERSQLQSQLDENEEEMTEVLKKYQASVQQLSSEQASLQEATTRISELEAETSSYKDQLAELNSKLESIETHGDPSSTLALKRLQLKCKELESKLEFEHTTRSRLEVQINRLKENTDKLQSECNVLRAKESASSNDVRKLQRTIRELKENIQSLEAKGINDSLKRKELEKEIQCREAEIATLKNELSVASQRIADLQHAIRGDIDDSDSDEDSDNRNSSSLSDERDHTKE